MPLLDTAIRAVKPTDKAQKLFDGGGLFLFVSPHGGKLWRLKYRFEGAEKLLSLGSYPQISLKDARKLREEAKEQIAKGIDPGCYKKAVKEAHIGDAQNTFELIALEWWHLKKGGWVKAHAEKVLARMKNYLSDLFPPHLAVGIKIYAQFLANAMNGCF